MPFLTLPPPTRRRDRWLAHPELTLGPAWVILGGLGIRDALAVDPPWHMAVLVLAVLTAAAVSAGGLLLLSAIAVVRPLSAVWMLERAGWITGATGWTVYLLSVGWRSDVVLILAPTMVALAVLRLAALGRTEAHVRDVKDARENGTLR